MQFDHWPKCQCQYLDSIFTTLCTRTFKYFLILLSCQQNKHFRILTLQLKIHIWWISLYHLMCRLTLVNSKNSQKWKVTFMVHVRKWILFDFSKQLTCTCCINVYIVYKSCTNYFGVLLVHTWLYKIKIDCFSETIIFG